MLAEYEKQVRRSEQMQTLSVLGASIAHQLRNAATGCRMALDGLMDECECVDPTLHDRLKGLYAKADQSKFQVRVGSSGNSFWFNAEGPRVNDRLP